MYRYVLASLLLVATGCDHPSPETAGQAAGGAREVEAPQREAASASVFFGRLNLHAASMHLTAEESFRYAQGQIDSPAAANDPPTRAPLDFAAVADGAGWPALQQAADRAYRPGAFSTFVACTQQAPGAPAPDGLVLFRGTVAPERPCHGGPAGSREQLWAWMDARRDDGIESLVIRISLPYPDAREAPETPAHGEVRLRNEPLAQIPHQTHEATYEQVLTAMLLRGLGVEAATGRNPFQLGFTGARLTGVWAAENTREALYDALRRRHSFATSGPRIVLKFHAGFDLPQSNGVPMGSDLLQPSGQASRSPKFALTARQDPNSAPLERLQIIKGWTSADGPRHRSYDVACSLGRRPDPASHRCPDRKIAVDGAGCAPEPGAADLRALWEDPDFQAGQSAFYYARVLENQSCRPARMATASSAAADGAAADVRHRETVTERAWSSPIWYHPEGALAPTARPARTGAHET